MGDGKGLCSQVPDLTTSPSVDPMTDTTQTSGRDVLTLHTHNIEFFRIILTLSVDKVKLRSVGRRSARAVTDLQLTLELCNTISDPKDIAYKTNKRSDASKHR